MADDYFLRIPGIEGESTDEKHKGEIEVLSWTWGETNPSSAVPGGGGGGGAGRVQMQDLQFTTRVSKAGPKLFLACAAGERLPKRCSPRERPEATGWSSLPTRSRTCS